MSNNDIKISVIMPSLNVGEYIEECILSVINQTLSEIEIICIDAGSTDDTLEILKKYAEKDSRITILNSNEKSYGHQVNMGLSKAQGQYISIIETDDFIDNEMFEKLYNLSDEGEVDIIKGTFYHYNDYNKDKIESKIDDVKSALPNAEKFTLKNQPRFIDGHPSIWAGIYNREFLEKNDIKVVEAPAGGWVDNPFFLETAIAAKSIVYTHQPLYYYRVSNPNSSSNTLNDFTIPMNRVLEMFEVLEKYDCTDENTIVVFYERLFRYIEIIIENNNHTDEDLDYDTCEKIHEVVKRVDENIVKERLKFNFQKIYYKYISPLFLARFNRPAELSDNDYDYLFKENDFLHRNVTYFRTKFNETNYKLSQLKQKYQKPADIKLKDKTAPKAKHHITPEIITKRDSKPATIYKDVKENEYTVSVIMPVFNGAKFLERSMASLLKQTLKNFEIVFIDDGSTDDSLEILRGYEKKYDFVKVLTQENSGSGKARNYGISEAKGEYIAFLDADDFFMDADALEKMYTLGSSNNADMVTANIKHDVENQGKFVPFGPFHYYRVNTVILPEQYGIPWSFYKNIFKREFLVKNDIYFPDLLRGQDPVFLAEALTKVDKIYVAGTDLYAYVYNSDTAKASNPRKLYDQILHYRQVIDYLDEPKFKRRQSEYFIKLLLFSSRLDDESALDAIASVRDIFKDMPDFLRRLENYLYLKFKHMPEVRQEIPWTKVSVIMELSNPNRLIEESLMSILNQNFEDFELILIDGLNDETFSELKEILNNKNDIKFIESKAENIASLRNKAMNEANGDYVYFCSDDYIYDKNILEKLFKTSVLSGSDVCLSNLPKGGPKDNPEINFKSLIGNVNYDFYCCEYPKIIQNIFSSFYDLPFAFFKKSFLKDSAFDENVINNESVFLINSILNSSDISFVPEFAIKYLKKNNIYYRSEIPKEADNALSIFSACDEIEEVLKEKTDYKDFKMTFDIYKINQIASYLESVRFIGSYSYNDPQNRDLYANDSKVLDYSQYYGSKSDFVGLNYTYAHEYFDKTKDEFNDMDYRDKKFMDLNANKFSNKNSLNKYLAVLKSDTYEEYMDIANFSEVEKLINQNKKIKRSIENAKNKQVKLTKEIEQKQQDYSKIEKQLETEVQSLENENKILTDENNRLREEYWEYRETYDYILASKSWKYTRWMRNE